MKNLFSSPMTVVAGLGLVLGLACTGGGTPSTETPPPPPPPPTEVAPPPAGGGSIGVASCDKYLKDFEACIPNLPEAVRPGMQESLKTTRSAWEQAAANPASKAALESSCANMQIPPVCNTGAAATPPATPTTPVAAPTGTPTEVKKEEPAKVEEPKRPNSDGGGGGGGSLRGDNAGGGGGGSLKPSSSPSGGGGGGGGSTGGGEKKGGSLRH